ncbi:MAG: 50S ribosomal protein L22 [Flavobacteriales bacterium]|nr:50S ribosomal protein L22 [Flavobacteriales bacterium]|tara:strand:- start:1002 stop:1397 length:396 start_codon:yes stop_codon:yes gene_type:complete
MGARKRNTADALNEIKKSQYFAKLNNCPTSPRKMRLVVDLVRGMEVYKALGVLEFSNKEASSKLVKLLKSAIHNYEAKTGDAPESGELFISKIAVDSARMLKRVQPAPQGRAHRIRKRSNHVTLFLEKVNQ